MSMTATFSNKAHSILVADIAICYPLLKVLGHLGVNLVTGHVQSYVSYESSEEL